LFSDPDVGKTIDKVFDRVDAEGMLKAKDYQDMSSELKSKIRVAWRTPSPDPEFADSLSQVVDALDELAEGNMSGEALSKLHKARAQWRALQALENSRAIHESGEISGPLLANYLRRTDKGGYLRGKNDSDFYEAARLSKAFPRRPDSGTAGRMTVQNMFSSPVKTAATLATSPLTSTAANLYFYGLPVAGRAIQAGSELAPGFVNPAMVGRASAAMVNPEDEIPYLLRR
jgi:hypothetical protein